MAILTATIEDDSGKQVNVFDPLRSAVFVKEDPSFIELQMRLARSAQGGLTDRVSPARLALAMTGFAGMLVYWLARYLGPGAPAWVAMVLAFAGAFAWVWMARVWLRHNHRRMIVVTMLGEGRCGSCGYVLAGTPAQNELIRCPECSAAWRASRVGLVRAPVTSGPVSPWRLTWRLPPTITDAQERAMRMLDIRGAALTDSLGKERGEMVRRAALRATLLKRLMMCVLMIVWAAITLVPLLSLKGRYLNAMQSTPIMSLLWVLGIAWFLIFVGLMGIKIWKGRTQMTSKRIASTLLRHLVCPACAGDLTGAAPTAEGLVTCPGCAATWKKV